MCPTNIPKIDPCVAINTNTLNIAKSTALCRNNGVEIMALKSSQRWITDLDCEINRETIICSHNQFEIMKTSTSFCHLALTNGFQPATFLSEETKLGSSQHNFPLGHKALGCQWKINICIYFFAPCCKQSLSDKGGTEQPHSLQWHLSWQWFPPAETAAILQYL